MKLVLDTSAYIECSKANSDFIEMLAKADTLYLPIVSYGELYYGFKYGLKFNSNLKRLDRFIFEFQVELINLDQKIAKIYGEICAELRKKGKPIPSNDLWIAACSKCVDGTLVTNDRHFEVISNLKLLTPKS